MIPDPDMKALYDEYQAGWPSFGCARCNKPAQDHKDADHKYEKKSQTTTTQRVPD